MTRGACLHADRNTHKTVWLFDKPVFLSFQFWVARSDVVSMSSDWYLWTKVETET